MVKLKWPVMIVLFGLFIWIGINHFRGVNIGVPVILFAGVLTLWQILLVAFDIDKSGIKKQRSFGTILSYFWRDKIDLIIFVATFIIATYYTIQDPTFDHCWTSLICVWMFGTIFRMGYYTTKK